MNQSFQKYPYPSVAVRTRIVAPDIARGLALFGIAWANISTVWAVPPESFAADMFGGLGPSTFGGAADQFFVVLSAMFAHNRGLPLFTFLVGFGVGLILLSLQRRGFPMSPAKAVLAKRYLWLLAIGVLHCIFLFWGDILILYSVLALILIVFVDSSNSGLVKTAGILYLLNLVVSIAVAWFLPPEILGTDLSFLREADSYAEWIGTGLAMAVNYFLSVPVMLFSLFPIMLLGFVAARMGIHKEPTKYLRLLWGWIIVTVLVIFGIGLPWGLNAIGVITMGDHFTWSWLNQAFGYLTGPGIAALILLACVPLQNKRDKSVQAGEPIAQLPLVLRIVEALGARSMSGYLFQSFAFFTICLPFTFNFGSELGATGQFLLALAVWVTSLLLAYALAVAGKKGPFEAIHRRLAYGKEELPENYELETR